MKYIFLVFCLFLSHHLFAADSVSSSSKIALVSVNGGSDSPNPGTTCFTIDTPVSSACTGTFIAIQNNNKELFAAVLHAKATGRDVFVYYRDNVSVQHCPGQVFTTCAVINIMLQ